MQVTGGNARPPRMKWHQTLRQWNGRDRPPVCRRTPMWKGCSWAASPRKASNEPLSFSTKSGSQGFVRADHGHAWAQNQSQRGVPLSPIITR